MSKTRELGKQLDKGLSAVDKQIAHWGLDPYKFKNIAAYEEALLGWQRIFMSRFDAATFECDLPYTEKLGHEFIQPFIRGDKQPLAANVETIRKAAEAEDNEFFIALGILLIRKEENELLSNHTAFGPKTYPSLLWFLWIRGLLWLMADNAVLHFLNGIFGQAFTLAGHREARKRLGLIRHPDTPITEVNWPSTSSSRSVDSSSGKRGFSMPVLKRGWVISEGILTRL